MLFSLTNLCRSALALVLLSGAVTVNSQLQAPAYDPSPFSFIGNIDGMTVNGGDGPLAGGTITVNGFKITVPKNTRVTLPSITVAWTELFNNGQPNLPLLGSVTWEGTVFGNNVKGEKIAGLIYITQLSGLQSTQGFITKIDYDTGRFTIDGALVCVLNDPLGRFGKAYSAHPLWSVDADNPSVKATTGFPICIPRNATDSECPLTNRPKDGNGKYQTSFTYPDPAKVVANGLNPNIMAPLVTGDYVTFAGIKTPDGVFAVFELEANLGIWTFPGTKPAYITVEEAIYGVIDNNPDLETAETRAVAFGTDTGTAIEWYAIEVDPCTGESTERRLGLAQPASIAPVGRVKYRLGKVDASPLTREVGFRYTNGISAGPRGLTAGEFIQPIFDFIFPELTAFGGRQIPNQFDTLPFLTQGSGPLEFGNYLTAPLETPLIVGQLSPWPGASAPQAKSCPPPVTPAPTTPAPPTTPVTPPTTPATPPTSPKDAITILTATSKNGKGQTTTSVTAKSDNTTAVLSMAITGQDNVKATVMNKLANGQFQLDISTKGKPTSVTITSSLGGDPVTRNV